VAEPRAVEVGQQFRGRTMENLTRTQIVQYAGASGDFNPLHSDEVYATQVAGYPSVFAHGMLTMGAIGRLTGEMFGYENIRSFGGRFKAQVWPGDDVTAHLTVESVTGDGPQTAARLAVSGRNQAGTEVFLGYAVVRVAVAGAR
jgi:acyl dehydratase